MIETAARLHEGDVELDVRSLRKPDKHPAIFAAYAALPVGGAFVLVNDHDPRHLYDEFASDHAGAFGWEYLRREPRDWRIRITRLTTTALPRVLADTTTLDAPSDGVDAAGAIWRLELRERDLDANVIDLGPGGQIEDHIGPDLDVLVHVLAGTGRVATEGDDVELAAGVLLWLPRGSRRGFTAGPEGLRYLTVHQRRQSLLLGPTRTATR